MFDFEPSNDGARKHARPPELLLLLLVFALLGGALIMIFGRGTH
jgi:hypothetical protein